MRKSGILNKDAGYKGVDDMNREYTKEQRKLYPRDEKYAEVCRWITGSAVLTEDMKNLFCDVFKGEPFQGLLYNTVIWNMDNLEYDTVVRTAGELYHFQRSLNKKIGRTCYDKIVKDEALIRHIYNEMAERFGSIRQYEYTVDFENAVMNIYLQEYAKVAKVAKTPEELYKACSDYKMSHPTASAEELMKFMSELTPGSEGEIKEVQYKEYFEECIRKNNPENNPKNSSICRPYHYTRFLELHSGSWGEDRLPKEKDELYILCIGLSLSITNFRNLRAALEREYRDSARFADNNLSYRDEKIQSVIRDIDTWYEKARAKYPKETTDTLPQKVLMEVDIMLKENGYALLYEPKRSKKQKGRK